MPPNNVFLGLYVIQTPIQLDMILTSTLRIISFFTIFCCLLSVNALTEVPNDGFENWDNEGNNDEEPQNWSANKTGGGLAGLAPQSCFRESNNPYAGTYCVKVETDSYFGAVVNGAATTGRIEAPNTNPANGYLRTIRNDAAFNSPFIGQPDNLVGYYRYQSGNSEVLVLHTNGQIVWQGQYHNTHQLQLQIADWPAGIYTVRMRATDREAVMKLVVDGQVD